MASRTRPRTKVVNENHTRIVYRFNRSVGRWQVRFHYSPKCFGMVETRKLKKARETVRKLVAWHLEYPEDSVYSQLALSS